jgi:hypothetical protein
MAQKGLLRGLATMLFKKNFFLVKRRTTLTKILFYQMLAEKYWYIAELNPVGTMIMLCLKNLILKSFSIVVNWVDLGWKALEKDFPSLEVIIPNKKL